VAGEKFAAVLEKNGTVWTWGNNDYGQLGIGTTVDSDVPVQVPGLTGIFRLAAGSNHILAIGGALKIGNVFGWGRNNHGQIGNGTTTEENSPVRIALNTRGYPVVATQIEAAGDHSIACSPPDSGNTQVAVFTWGDNTHGEIGNGTTTDAPNAVQVILSGLPPIAIAAGSNHCLALSNSQIYAWGDDEDGELGDGGSTEKNTPESIALTSTPMEIFAGDHTSYFLDEENTLYDWGLNSTGQLGLGNTAASNTPETNYVFALSVASFANHLIILGIDTTTPFGDLGTLVYGCGDNSQGELDSTAASQADSPVVAGFQNNYNNAYEALAGGQKHSLALDATGALWEWGNNSSGQLGDGTTTQELSPEENPQWANLNRISAGALHSAGIDLFGDLWTWGDNTYGQLGNGTTTNSNWAAPIAVNLMKEVAAGGTHTLALMDDGTVWAAGDNREGELGDGTATQRTTMVQVVGLTGIKAIAAGPEYSLALRDDGTVWAWGQNSYGQLGSGSTTATMSPIQVESLTNVMSLTAGVDHALAIEANGSVWGWGSNATDESGNANPQSSSVPQQISMSDSTAIFGLSVSAGSDFSSIISATGNLIEFGANDSGQLDNNIQQNQLPVIVQSGLTTALISNGYEHVLFQPTNGSSLLTWGDNAEGQLGNGVITPPSLPAAPLNVTAALEGTSAATVSWTPGDDTANEFSIQASPNAGGTWVQAGYANGTATSLAASGLNPGVSYIFSVTAINQTGQSPATNSASIQTPYTTPAAPILYPTIATPGGVELSWYNNNGSDASATLVEQKNSDGSYTTIATLASGADTYNVTGVSVGTSVTYRVVSYNPVGASTSSDSVATTTLPYPIYGYITLPGMMRADYISSSGVVTGEDQTGALARWSQGTITEMNVYGTPFQGPNMPTFGNFGTPGYFTNPNGDIVTTFSETTTDQMGDTITVLSGLHWGPIDTAASPDYGDAITLSDGSLKTSMQYVSITDSGSIYGMHLAVGDGYVSPNEDNLYTPYPNGYYIYPGNSAPPSVAYLPVDGESGNFQYNLIFKIQSDSFSGVGGTETEMGQAGEPTSNGVYAGAGVNVYLATTGMVVLKNSDGTYTANSQPISFSPVAANDTGILIGETADSVGGLSSTFWWDSSSNTPYPLSSEDDVVTGINSRTTNNLQDFQIVGTLGYYPTLWEKLRDSNGNPTGLPLPVDIGAIASCPSLFSPDGINNEGLMCGAVGGQPAMLFYSEMAVDANRDGTIVMANDANNPTNRNNQGNFLPVDTTVSQPYRFWLNNDDDNGSGTGGSEVISSPTPDSNSDHIVSVRDLEDWNRLWIYTKGLNTAIASGAIKVGLKWKNVASGTTPGIKLVKATDSDGGLEYLQDSTGAAASAQTTTGGPILVDAGGSHSNIVPTSASADFVFPTSVWASLTDAAPKTYFLFEGTSEGKGQLEIVFLKSDGTTEIGEGGNLWLDLHDVKEMYQREKAEPETIAAPYSSGSDDPAPVNMTPADDTGSFTFSPDPNETKDYFVFVHGWNMSYDGSTNYAETMFKRLWWRGYKGRFAAFRWPTYYSNFPVFDPYGTAAIEASLARYNDSEYIGWESGHALAQYVNSLPSGYTRHVASHSMGAIVVASAFQQPTPMSAAYYTPLHAAIPAYCYDPTTTALEDAYTTAGYVTPDHDSDPATSSMAYRGRVTGVGGATVTSFYDSADSALQSWESNNHLTKPQPLYAYLDGYYFYSPSSPNGQKLGLQFILVTGRYMTDKYESMAYADKSLTKTLGADGRTAGLIGSGVDMNANYSFGTEHSAEFGRPITQVERYYYDVMSHLGLSENYLDATHPAISP
jgi:alpha-tubulin suppressor-like RCC1 family protein